jgi:GTPase KRas protein
LIAWAEDSYSKVVNIDNQVTALSILDTAGQEDFRSLLDSWIRSGEGFLLCYDIGSRQSFEEIQMLRERVLQCKDKDAVPMVIVGNKCDLPDERRQVPKAEAEKLGALLI